MAIDLFDDVSPAPSPVGGVDIFEAPPAATNDLSGVKQYAIPILLAVLVFFALTRMRGCTPSDDTVVDVDGTYVMVLEEVDKREELPAAQLSIFNSSRLREWYDANCAEDGYRCFDVDDDLAQEKPMWKKLKDGVTLKPPVLVIANKRKTTQQALPANVEAMMRELQKSKRRR